MGAIAGAFGPADVLAPVPAILDRLRHRGPAPAAYVALDTWARTAWLVRGGEPGVAWPASARLVLGQRGRRPGTPSGPHRSADGRLHLVADARLHDPGVLRQALGDRIRALRVDSDGALMVEALAAWGPEAIQRFEGAFALAVWDTEARTLLCARDRFGVRPLHYCWDGTFVFASEATALAADARRPARVREEAVHDHLRWGREPSARETFVEGWHALPPGHRLVLHAESRRRPTLVEERWYELPDREGTPEDALHLRRLLEPWLAARAAGAGRLGLCLTGRLEEAALLALAGRAPAIREPPVVVAPATAAGEPDPLLGLEARARARRVGPPSPREIAAELPELVRPLAAPPASPEAYLQRRLLAAARASGAEVVAVGHGAAEAFAGDLGCLGPLLVEMAERKGRAAALRTAWQARRATGASAVDLVAAYAYHRGASPTAVPAARRLHEADPLPEGTLDAGFAARAGRATLPVRRTLSEHRRSALLDRGLPARLHHLDATAAALGLEVLLPFLDPRLVEWALRQPAETVVRGGWPMAILREALAGALPDALRWRRSAPVAALPAAALATAARSWLSPSCRIAAYLQPDLLRTWLAEGDVRLARRPGLFRVVTLELWLRSFA